MRFLETILFVFMIGFKKILAGTYENSATFYGKAPGSNDGYSELNPSCGDKTVPLHRNFCALSVSYDNKYCHDYVIALTADPDAQPKNAKANMVMAEIVDSCESCAKNQVDLSFDTFSKFATQEEGVHKIYWVIMDTDGNIKLGPLGASLDKLAEKFEESEDNIKQSFLTVAKEMVKNKKFDHSNWPWKKDGTTKPITPTTSNENDDIKDKPASSTTTNSNKHDNIKDKPTSSTTTTNSNKHDSIKDKPTSSTNTTNSNETETKKHRKPNRNHYYYYSNHNQRKSNFRCGEKYGECKKGCCSSYGWCGTSDEHCLYKNGCQDEFGECFEHRD